MWAVVCEAYVKGVSTRKVDDLVKAMGATDSGLTNIFCGIDNCRARLLVLGIDHSDVGVTIDFGQRDMRLYIPWLLSPTQMWPTWGCIFIDSSEVDVTPC